MFASLRVQIEGPWVQGKLTLLSCSLTAHVVMPPVILEPRGLRQEDHC